MHFGSIPLHLVTLTVPSMSNFTMNYDLQKMLHCQLQSLRLEFFKTIATHLYVGLVANTGNFIADDDHVPRLTIAAGVLPLDISYQPLSACLVRSQNELQAPATHWC